MNYSMSEESQDSSLEESSSCMWSLQIQQQPSTSNAFFFCNTRDKYIDLDFKCGPSKKMTDRLEVKWKNHEKNEKCLMIQYKIRVAPDIRLFLYPAGYPARKKLFQLIHQTNKITTKHIPEPFQCVDNRSQIAIRNVSRFC